MKRIILLILPVLVGFVGSAQESSVISGINYNQLERFIALAKENYPQRKILSLNEEKAKSVFRSQPLGYLEMLNASYFYRPAERSAINVENPFIVNGFQLGVHLNLASLAQRPALTKQAKADYEIAKLESEAYEQVLANEVKRRYYEYIRVLEDLKIKTQALGDSKSLQEDLQYKFERGEVDLESYSLARTTLSSARTDVLEVEMSMLLAKDALEEIIGVKLSDL